MIVDKIKNLLMGILNDLNYELLNIDTSLDMVGELVSDDDFGEVDDGEELVTVTGRAEGGNMTNPVWIDNNGQTYWLVQLISQFDLGRKETNKIS